MKYYDKNKESTYWDVHNLYGLANGFKWVDETFQFDEDFIKKL